MRIDLPGSMDLGNLEVPQDDDVKNLLVNTFENSLFLTASEFLVDGTRVRGVTISQFGSFFPQDRRLYGLTKSRFLEGTSVNYNLLLEVLCETEDCSDGDAVADAFVRDVQDTMIEEVNSGNFAETVKQVAVANNVTSAVANLAVEEVTSASFQA